MLLCANIVSMTDKQLAAAAVQRAHKGLEDAKKIAEQSVSRAAEYLTSCIVDYFGFYEGSLRSMAKDMGISAPYLSDILNGNRGVSDAFMEKLGALTVNKGNRRKRESNVSEKVKREAARDMRADMLGENGNG